MYDALIIGARVAGAPTAMLLARAGHRVLLVDRDRFPSDTLSTHFLHAPGVARLRRWGLLDRLEATDCPPLAATFGGPEGEGLPAYCPRRTVLDALLLDAAKKAGAEVREGFSVSEVLVEDGRVVGVRGRGADGVEVEEHARVVVGADGKHSRVARAVEAEEYATVPARTCGYYAYFSGTGIAETVLAQSEGQCVLAFPTHDQLTCVAVQWPVAEFATVRADIEGRFALALEREPAVAAGVRGGRRETQFKGTTETRGFFRKPYGPGWALVGDAGYHKDPILGYGITDAFRDAELLAQALDAGFSGREPLEAALAGYQARRDAAVMPIYELTCEMATLNPSSPRLGQLFAALQGAPVAAAG